MYSVILIAAMAAPADATAWGHHGGCSCSGYSCTGYSCGGCGGYGACGGGHFGGGFLGHRQSCYGCYGCSGTCHGAGACYGYAFGGVHAFGFAGCYGSCYGSYTNFFSYWAAPAQVQYGYGMPMHVAPMMQPPLAPAIKPPVRVEEPKPIAPKPAPKPAPKKDTEKKIGQTPTTATVIVTLPADAILYANGARTRLTSGERHFTTPALEAGMDYNYILTMEVIRDGRMISESREIEVQAGAEIRVDFNSKIDATGIAIRD